MMNVIYANARAKALENVLLGVDRLNRMIDSASPEEAMKILSEVNFGGGVIVDSFLDFERLISAEEKAFISFVRMDCPSDALKNYFLLPFDFHNAEAFIKEKYLKKQVADLTVESGLFDKESMKEKIMLDEYKRFPEEMAKALLFCDGEFTSGRATGASVGAAFKCGLYKELYKNARQDNLLKQIFSVRADCANFSTALRSDNYNSAKRFFVVGGKLTANDLKIISEEPVETLKEKFKFTEIGDLIAIAIDSLAKDGSMSDFETAADGYALSLLKKRKYSTEGAIPFMLYCFYKLAEIKNVRIVLVGLINGTDKNEIRRRLRNTYEG